MNNYLENIKTLLAQSELSEADKTALTKALSDADKQWAITDFKLDRTEKVKRTTAILLEETIGELEHKRMAVEVQNKELEIESALERVRTIALSMNKREDMLDVCRIISGELEKLRVKEIRNVQTAIFYEQKKTYMNYEYYVKHDKSLVTEASYTDHEVIRLFAEQMLKGRGQSLSSHFTKAELPAWIDYQKTTNVFIDQFLESADSLHYYWQSLGPVALGISTYQALTDDEQNLFQRFTKVFELAYRRYLDIEKAETQAREAQLQLALERVRAKTMAMHHSGELAETASILFQQIKELGFETWSCGFCIWKDDETLEAWMGADSGEVLPPLMIPYKEEKTHHEIFKAGSSGETSYDHVWKGAELDEHYTFMKTIPSVKHAFDALEAAGLQPPSVQCYYAGFFKNGYLLLITTEVNPELKDISARFAKVFDLTYTRFLDLKKAEAQARESQVQLALERVRARTMAMQHSDELADASFVLDTQVRSLGVQTRGCAFNIYGEHESTEWFSSELGTMPTYKTPHEDFFSRAFEAGKKGQQIYVEEFAGENCKAHYEYLSTLPVLGDALRNMIASGGSFPERQIDHATFFKYGYLLFITLEPAPEAHETFIRFAKVFEQTYTRFLDLQKAEAQTLRAEQDLLEIKAARKKAEDTLIELQATQKQLIQSEKMASLGELTAGIAHEIQNPLNFVNNFSDVSSELIDEMNTELDNGDIEEAKAIAADIKQNLEKINHHGKRADGIVKGMLQHSRKNDGKKEPTDINVLCDEYLRLSYHGIRAKDKSFNALLKTDFDESVGKVNIVPQDIGRVIMNLLTNAFYAVNQNLTGLQNLGGLEQNLTGLQNLGGLNPKQQPPTRNPQPVTQPYVPTVSIRTQKLNNNTINIIVEDNGAGIPESVKEKIFQPFFTTKPTGQGTGLGLSLAYDIVKAHGGELKVETKEGEGSKFIIQIPVV